MGWCVLLFCFFFFLKNKRDDFSGLLMSAVMERVICSIMNRYSTVKDGSSLSMVALDCSLLYLLSPMHFIRSQKVVAVFFYWKLSEVSSFFTCIESRP